MSHLILVRHALPNIDPDVRSEDWTLSAAGAQAAAGLSLAIAGYAPKEVLSGPEAKLIATADVIAKHLGLPVRVVPALAEHRRRSAAYASDGEFETAVAALFDNPAQVVYGEESADSAYQRLARALDREFSVRSQDTVLAVSGGTVISLFISRRAGIAPFPLWRSIGMPTAVVLDGTNRRVLAIHRVNATVDRGAMPLAGA
jgi:broad specificity phosphatase PhoE